MTKIIFSETTSKLRTRVITLSSVSLFIGLTEKIPNDFTIIGLKLSETDKTLGWFILVATVVIFLYFLMRSYLEIEAYNAKEIIQNKTKDTQCEITGFTEEEHHENYYQSQKNEEYTNDMDSINEQNRIIKANFITNHIMLKKWIIYIFEFVLPVILAMIGMFYLFDFLV